MQSSTKLYCPARIALSWFSLQTRPNQLGLDADGIIQRLSMPLEAFAEEKSARAPRDEAKGRKKPHPPVGAPPRRISRARHDQPHGRKLPRRSFESTAESKLGDSPMKSNEMKSESGGKRGVETKGVLGVSSGARAQLLQSQREAALRRRSVQMRSGVLVRADGPLEGKSDELKQAPSIRTFSVPRAENIHRPNSSVDQHMNQQRDHNVHGSNEKENVESRRIATPGDQNMESSTSKPMSSFPGSTGRHSSSKDLTADVSLASREKGIPLKKDKSVKTGQLKALGRGDEKFYMIPQQSCAVANMDEKESEAERSFHSNSFNSDRNTAATNNDDNVTTPKRKRMFRSDTNPPLLAEDDYAEKECGSMLMGNDTEPIETSFPKCVDSLSLDDPEKMKDFLMSPCPKKVGIVECYVKRHRSGRTVLNPEYRVYMKEGNVFLMSSKKRGKKKSSNYLISVERSDHSRSSSNIIGKLRSNFLGTEYTIYDAGRNPRDTDPFFDEKNDDTVRSELGAVLYSSKIIGNTGPRKMKVCINKTDAEGKSLKQWQPAHRDEEMAQVLKHRVEPAVRKLVQLENRQPSWCNELGAFILNFNGRVTRSSVKNFQLVEENRDDTEPVLQFGRVANDEFTLDFQWPMSPFQAFAIALSSCDSKLACD